MSEYKWKWYCNEHDTEIEVKNEEPEEVLKEVPPKCPKTGEKMETVKTPY